MAAHLEDPSDLKDLLRVSNFICPTGPKPLRSIDLAEGIRLNHNLYRFVVVYFILIQLDNIMS